MPIVVRYTQDAISRSGWLWPVDAKGFFFSSRRRHTRCSRVWSSDVCSSDLIYLLNVAELKEKALKNLEEYVKNGGSVAFFLGDKVRPEFYNKFLYKDGKGLFPAPLADREIGRASCRERV